MSFGTVASSGRHSRIMTISSWPTQLIPEVEKHQHVRLTQQSTEREPSQTIPCGTNYIGKILTNITALHVTTNNLYSKTYDISPKSLQEIVDAVLRNKPQPIPRISY